LLPTRNRIKETKDLKKVLKEGRRAKNEDLAVVFQTNHKKLTRFAFIISTKISKKATIRNRLKRRLSEIIQKQNKNILAGFDVVIVPSPSLEKKDFKGITKQVNKVMYKARLIKKIINDD